MPLYHFRNELVSSDNTHSSPLPFATKSMSVEGVEGVDGVVVDGVVVDVGLMGHVLGLVCLPAVG